MIADMTYPIMDASDMTLPIGALLREVVATIDRSDTKIVLIVDPAGILVGSITDGDVRRGLLRGCTLDSPAQDVMHKDPCVLPLQSTRQQLLEMMDARNIHHIPLLNPNGTIAGIVTRDGLFGRAQALHSTPIVIMAGGKGQRLMPLTTTIPKPMVEISGRPMLEWILHRFVNQGFREFYITINHLGHVIEEYFGDGSALGSDIHYVREPEPLGTAGSLSLLKHQLKEPFIVINGDIIVSIDFPSIIDYHKASHAAATVCVRPHRMEVPYGVVGIKDGMLQTITEKPIHENLISAGIYVMEPDTLNTIPENTTIDMPNLLLSLVQKNKKVAVFPMREDWLDIGRHDDLDRAKNTFVSSA